MASFLSSLLGRTSAPSALELASLQLELLVAMAVADDRLHMLETDQLDGFITRAARTPDDALELRARLDELLAAPPDIDEVLEDLAMHADRETFGRRTIEELARMAGSDDQIDHREEFLLDLVCDVFGVPPVALHDANVEYEDLHGLVHRLALVSRDAA